MCMLFRHFLQNLEREGLLRGTLSVDEQYARIKGSNDLAESVKGAVYVQVYR